MSRRKCWIREWRNNSWHFTQEEKVPKFFRGYWPFMSSFIISSPFTSEFTSGPVVWIFWIFFPVFFSEKPVRFLFHVPLIFSRNHNRKKNKRNISHQIAFFFFFKIVFFFFAYAQFEFSIVCPNQQQEDELNFILAKSFVFLQFLVWSTVGV